MAQAAHPDANIIFGAMLDEKLEDQVWVTVVATGYSEHRRHEREHPGVARPRASLQEPNGVGEPRVSRLRRSADSLGELDVPEFIPRS